MKNYFFLFLVLVFFPVVAKSQTTQTIKLTQLERGQAGGVPVGGLIGLTRDSDGKQRYATYVEVNPVCIAFTPPATGNTTNYSQFVTKCSTDSVWYIDYLGNSILLGTTGGGNNPDRDWLKISNNQIPYAITDSIYTDKYAAVNMRRVWPSAQFLVGDSTSLLGATSIVAGDRSARQGYYRLNDSSWVSMGMEGGSLVGRLGYNAGAFVIQKVGGWNPAAASAPFRDIARFNADSTIQFLDFPRTRVDTSTVVNFLYTDPDGFLQSRPVSDIISPLEINKLDSAYNFLFLKDSLRVDSVLTKNDIFTLNTSSSHFWGDYTQYIGEGRVPDSLYWVSNVTGDLLIGYVTISGGNATIIDVDTVTAAVGLNVVKMSPSSYSNKTYVVARPRIDSQRTLAYKSGLSGQPSFHVPVSGGAVFNYTNFSFAFWISFHRMLAQDNNASLIEEIPQIKEDIINAGLVRCTTDHCIRNALSMNGYVEIDTTVIVDSVIYVSERQQIIGFGNAELRSVSEINIVQVEGDNAKISGVLFSGSKSYDPASSTQISNISQAIALNGIGLQQGIVVDSSVYVSIIDCHFQNLDKGITGTYSVPSLSKVSNCSFSRCYIGLDVPQRWEYNSFSNLSMYECLIGVRYIGGNNNLSNITGRDHRIGILCTSGDNSDHYTINNSIINHCYLFGVYLNNLQYNATFSNCQIWVTGGDNALTVNNSRFTWNGGYIDDNVVITGSLVGLIANCLFNDVSTVTGTINLKNNYRMDGSTTGVQN